jgi:two-component sensor histidine kinase
MKILHLEDSESDAELIYAALSQGDIAWQVKRVQTREAFLDAVDEGDCDVILADYSLPCFDGISALHLVRKKLPEIPFIFVTGSLGEERAVELLKNGATDYVLKHRLARLPLAASRAVRESEIAKAGRESEQNLRHSLREKELLLQEVHHRINNNLQIVCTLLSMQADANDDPILASSLRASEHRIRSMAAIHAMLYASSSLRDIDFAEYTRLLAAEASSSYGIDPARIRLCYELEPIRFEIDRAIPCGLILNELLSNAFVHAFPDGRSGEIHVLLRERDGRIRLAVEDTGIGIHESHVQGQRRSIGFSIIETLAEQLGGHVEITSNQGSQFVLEFSPRFDDQ